MTETTTMKITKQQLADLVRGIGSVHVSTGGYEGDVAYVALGMVYQALADEILDGPSEDYEVPPVRTTAEDTPVKRILPNTAAALPGSEAWIGRTGCESGADSVILHVKCSECGEVFSRPLTAKETEDVEILFAYGGRHPDGHVQDVFPGWSPADRELFLQSHLCDPCWKKLMSPPDEERTPNEGNA